MFIATIPEVKDNLLLIKKVRSVNKHAKIFVTASEIDEALKLYSRGANYVILPHFLGGIQVANLIADVRKGKTKLQEEKADHLVHLQERKDLGHEHPSHH
jgi:voltage-gated potassium channel Kch